MDQEKLETLVDELSKVHHNLEYIQAILHLLRTRPHPDDEASDKVEMLMTELSHQSLTLMGWVIRTLEREQQRASLKLVDNKQPLDEGE